jgi:outer membrane immunogenic protein
MRRFRFLFATAKYLGVAALTAVAFLACPSDSRADGMAQRAAPVAQAASWSGLYFGVHSGWQWSDVDVNFPSFGTAFSVSHDSPVVGGHIGIQHQFGQIVLGVEGNLTVSYQNNAGSTNCPNAAFTCSSRFDDVLTVGPRIGWAMGKWMPYITGGYASGAFPGWGRTVATGVSVEEARARLSGWYIGGGVEMALAAGWSMAIDYRHYDFGDATEPGHTPGGAFIEPWRFDASSDILTLRVSWKLGRPEPVRPLK